MIDKRGQQLPIVEQRNDPAYGALKSFLLTAGRSRFGSQEQGLDGDLEPERNHLSAFLADERTWVIRVLGKSGSGKTTVVSFALEDLDKDRYSVSWETRASLSQAHEPVAPPSMELINILVIDGIDESVSRAEREILIDLINSHRFQKIILAGRNAPSLDEPEFLAHQATIRLT